MKREFFEQERQAARLTDQGHYKSAKTNLERLLATYTEPQEQALVGYDLGASYWTKMGNGEEARRLFQLTVEKCKESRNRGIMEVDIPVSLEAYASENLMLLSLSYEEYDKWATNLEQLQPQNPILHILRSQVHEGYERGFPWWRMMMGFVGTYTDTDPAKDPRQWGCAASILQLLLKHRYRNELRLSRDGWEYAVRLYVVMIGYICGTCAQRRVPPDEFIFIAEESLPLVEEFANEFPESEVGREGLSILQELPRKSVLEMKTSAERSASEEEDRRVRQIQESIEHADIEGYLRLQAEDRRCPQCGSYRTGVLPQIPGRGTLTGSLIFILAAMLCIISQFRLQTTQALFVGLAGLALAAVCIGSFVMSHGKGTRYGCLSCGHNWYAEEDSSSI